MSDERERLIREVFEGERDFFYLRFRQNHWNEPEIVAACPDPATREALLRGFWNQDAEGRYPEYRETVAGLSLAELEAERDRWAAKLNGAASYRDVLQDAARWGPPA